MSHTEERVRESFEPYEFTTSVDAIVGRAERRSRNLRTGRFALVASGLAVVMAIGVFSRSPEALAYWDPVPSTPDAILYEIAPELCVSQLELDDPLMPLVLIDQRANAARAVFGEGGAMSVCTLVKADGEWTAPATEDLPFVAYTFAGVVEDPDAAEAIIHRPDGLVIEGVVADGFFHFWGIEPEVFTGGEFQTLDSEGNILSEWEVPPLDS